MKPKASLLLFATLTFGVFTSAQSIGNHDFRVQAGTLEMAQSSSPPAVGGKGAAIGAASGANPNIPPGGVRPNSSAPAPLQRTSGGELPVAELVRMGGRDQVAYMNAMTDHIIAATPADQRARVDKFYAAKQAGDDITGVGQFQVMLAEESLREIEDPQRPRETVEGVMRAALALYGIRLAAGTAAVPSFTPVAPLQQPPTKEAARKARDEAKAWAYRNAGPVTAAELQDPPNAIWVSRLDFEQDSLVWALFTGHLDEVKKRRQWQVLRYIASMDATLGSICPSLNDDALIRTANRRSEGLMQEEMNHTMQGRDTAAVKAISASFKEYEDAGEADAKTLAHFAPSICQSVTAKKIYNNMRLVAEAR